MLNAQADVIGGLADDVEFEAKAVVGALHRMCAELALIEAAAGKLKGRLESDDSVDEAIDEFEDARVQIDTILARYQLESEDLVKLVTLVIPQVLEQAVVDVKAHRVDS